MAWEHSCGPDRTAFLSRGGPISVMTARRPDPRHPMVLAREAYDPILRTERKYQVTLGCPRSL